ncbi:HNH endonuclease signature motif containing protein [uncultured Desulfosarcina sp.]|uniref:HNH endonuclease n=1 Tax=uncultured Desulfosarcina sp. TaxID=218289 RepID=UPI0029C61BCF|nr:HNH endonuclease signature motif containing protein [uncultured Desulfosarcina sp.]
MTLSKLEIQQMLREMNVKFAADETYEDLKQRLQKENRSLWLKSVSTNRAEGGSAKNVVVRKRRKETAPGKSLSDAPTEPANLGTEQKPTSRSDAARFRRRQPEAPRHIIEKPAPGKPWKETADGTQPFNRKKKVFETVLRRSRMCCENCGKNCDAASGQPDLQPFHITPLDADGEHSIKNVVALCPDCLATLQNEPDPKTIKELKRKTRIKIYDSLEVVRKKKVRGRRRFSGRLR